MRTPRIASWPAVFAVGVAVAAAQEIAPPKGFPDPRGSDETNGPHFLLTSAAYENEATRLLVEEAGRVATDLNLPERLPLTQSNIVRSFICPFGLAFIEGTVGNVESERYTYVAAKGWRFSNLTIADWSRVCSEYAQKYRWPAERLDTNSAYALATQWLAAVSMDVAALNRDCSVKIGPSPHWNRFRWRPPFTNATFTPIYCIDWIPRQGTNAFEAAEVELFAPDKTLLALRIEDKKYILRPPLQFTNLDELLAHPTTHWHSRRSNPFGR